jgi:hypothetical protein
MWSYSLATPSSSSSKMWKIEKSLNKHLSAFITALLVVLYCSDLVSAQTGDQPSPTGQSQPQFPALFGGSLRSSARQSLDLTVSLGAGYVDNVLPPGLLPSQDPFSSTYQSTGFYATLYPVLAFESRGDMNIQATAGSDIRYDRVLGETRVLGHSLAAEFSGRAGQKTGISLGPSVQYAPASLGGLFVRPSEPTVGDFDVLEPGATDEALDANNYVAASVRQYVFNAFANVDHTLSRRGTLTLRGEGSYTKTEDGDSPVVEASFPEFRRYGLDGRYRHQVHRNLALRFGYTYGNVQYVNEDSPLQDHTAEIGFIYERRRSATRKTTLDVTVGSTLFGFTGLASPPPTTVPPEIESGPTSSEDGVTESEAPVQVSVSPPATLLSTQRQSEVIGHFQLTHDIGKQWSAIATYERGIFYVSGLRDAVFNDGITLGAHGFVNRRIDINAEASYSKGSFMRALNEANDYTSYSGNIRARFALVRDWATYVDYLYYYYRVDNTLALPNAFPSSMTRNSIRVGFTLWVPIMRHR